MARAPKGLQEDSSKRRVTHVVVGGGRGGWRIPLDHSVKLPNVIRESNNNCCSSSGGDFFVVVVGGGAWWRGGAVVKVPPGLAFHTSEKRERRRLGGMTGK